MLMCMVHMVLVMVIVMVMMGVRVVAGLGRMEWSLSAPREWTPILRGGVVGRCDSVALEVGHVRRGQGSCADLMMILVVCVTVSTSDHVSLVLGWHSGRVDIGRRCHV